MTGADLAHVVLLALVVHRAWRILAVDEMPWLVKARRWFLGLADHPSGAVHVRRPTLKKWLECPWCCGAWLAVIAVAADPDRPDGVVRLAFYWAAVSALVGIIVRNLDPTED